MNDQEAMGPSMEPELSASPRRTVTRAYLAAVVHERLGGSRQDAQRLVDATFSEIMDALVRGERAKLVSFGSFVLRTKSSRVGRNPKTEVKAQIATRRVVTFNASMTLRDHVSGKTARDKSKA
jgi:integration host factor subunit alpha